MGISYPVSAREKLGSLEETLQIVPQMWKADTSPYQGQYYKIDEPLNSPQLLSKPHLPILIGTDGEKVTLRLVAKYADASNLHLGTPPPEYGERIQAWFHNRQERLPRKLALLKGYCYAIGRTYDEIERTVLGMVKLDPEAMSAAEVFDICAEMAEMGFNQVIYTAVSPLHATVTAHALLASECLFRIGFVSFLLTAIFFLLTAWALYKLLKQVN